MKVCIWCKQENFGGSEEHIFPDAIGCPPEFVFNDGSVCTKCNNGLGHLDQAVIDEFDIFLFENEVKRKKNRKPAIKSRGNLVAGFINGEKYYSLNMEKHSILDPYGNKVAAYRGKERDVKGSIEISNGIGKVSFEITLSNKVKFRQGLVKIALSTLAYYLGSELALESQFDPVRKFVNEGKGERPILWYVSEDLNFRNQAWSPYVDKHNNYSVTFRIAMYEFLIDLSPDVSLFYDLREKANKIYEKGRFGSLPINA